MLRNHFGLRLFASAAAEKMGLTMLSREDLMSPEFMDSVEVGDYFLQYRRASVPPRFLPEYYDHEVKHLPAILKESCLTGYEVGVAPPKRNSSHAFRIFCVSSIEACNEMCLRIMADSVYSTPQHWSYKDHSGLVRKWKDIGYAVDSQKPCRRTLTIKTGDAMEEGYTSGIVGRFDIDKISKYIIPGTNHDYKVPEFFPLFRILTSTDMHMPSVQETINSLEIVT